METAACGGESMWRFKPSSRRVLELAGEMAVLLLHTAHCGERMCASARERAMQGGRAVISRVKVGGRRRRIRRARGSGAREAGGGKWGAGGSRREGREG